MKRWHKVSLAVLLLAVVAAGVARMVSTRKAQQAQAAAPKATAVLELAASDLLPVRRAELTRTLEVSGSLVAVNSAFVKARVAAEVKSVAVREGDSVKPGQLLAQLDPVEFDWRLRQAEQQAQAARAQLEIAQRALQNSRSLVTQGFISATALENAVSTEAGAQATLQAAQAAVELARKARADATVTAPIGGQISQRLVQPGERVPVDAKLLEIVDLSRLELQASVAPEDAGQLHVGDTARLKVDGIDGALTARVVRINPSAQPGSRSVVAYLELAPHPALRQGLFARGRVAVAEVQGIAVPLAAVRTDLSQPYVLQVSNGKTTLKTVKLGARGELAGQAWVIVSDGLAEGATVLTGSAGAVRDGTPVRLVGPAAASAAR